MERLINVVLVLLVLLAAASAAGTTPQAGKQTTRPCDAEPAGKEAEIGWFDCWKAFKKQMQEETGTSVGLCLNNTNQVILNGPKEGKDRHVFWWNLNLTQDLWPEAKLIVNTRGGSGRGLGHLIGDKLNTNWMAGETRCLYVSHLLLEQKLFDGKLTFWGGKLDIDDYFDTNEVASWNFLSYSLARNPTIPCPWHAVGAVVRYQPTDWLYAQAGAVDAQGSGTETGLNTAFHDEDYFFSMYEVGFRTSLARRPGNYRFILWYDPQPVDRIDGGGSKRDDTGFALSFDQQLTDKVSAFFRYGHAHQQVRQVENFWSVGARYTGLIPQRGQDVLALGVGQAIMGGDYRDANAGSASNETIFELYYEIKVNEWCSVTPDLQVILNPGASQANDTAVVMGLKLCLSF